GGAGQRLFTNFLALRMPADQQSVGADDQHLRRQRQTLPVMPAVFLVPLRDLTTQLVRRREIIAEASIRRCWLVIHYLDLLVTDVHASRDRATPRWAPLRGMLFLARWLEAVVNPPGLVAACSRDLVQARLVATCPLDDG